MRLPTMLARQAGRHLLKLYAPVLALSVAFGCQTDPYALTSYSDGAPFWDARIQLDGQINPKDGTPSDADGLKDGPSGDADACVPSNGGQETCDGQDNDCNGTVDDVDPSKLADDPDNCGECGKACVFINAFAKCVQGKCEFDRCADTFYDINKDVTKDGCEYNCVKTNSGVEVCDEIDNDCNGTVDDGFDKQTDITHCGKCNTACLYSHGTPACQAGVCAMTGCEAGFADNNKDDKDGCEYQCPVFPIATETCNGKDDDCNGQIDEGLPGAGQSCDTGKLGECKAGTTKCDGGKITCIADNQSSPEVCDQKDNDCNGTVDDGFDLQTSVRDCGKCGKVCSFPNAVPKCVAGKCEIDQCLPGYKDLDTQVAGCEHKCQNWPESAEKCNQQDDDCDNQVDEDFDLTSDVKNCGQCGKVCSFPNAAASCVNSKCTQGACFNDFYDIDSQVPGCEYYCVKSNNGNEICDDLDNDCNGTVDDGFNKQTDVQNCGSCGNVCQFNNATATCVAGKCQIGTCAQGFIDLDPQLPGCEYKCPVFPPTADETSASARCDGVDNDCDGQIDEDYPTGQSCGTNQGECTAGTLTCVGGVEVCQGEVKPVPETCNNRDDDCNGTVDDGFDKLNDPRYCNCVQCNLPHAISTCNMGVCEIAVCEAGYIDLDPGQPGCEYQCTPTGPEICDGIDNDCNGQVDDGVTAPSGLTCVSIGPCAGTTATCQGSNGWVCNYPSNVELLPCLTDADCGGQVACNQTTGTCPGIVVTNELRCDGEDGDCDGVADDPWNNIVLPQSIGKACVPNPSAQGICQGKGEYRCNAAQDNVECFQTQAGQSPRDELCNGLDDDCDGSIDESTDDGGGLGVRDTVVHINRTVGTTNYNFYIYAYEATRPDANGTSAGGMDHRACSKSGALPWTSVTYAQAAAACAAAGRRLCTGAEWQVACQGAAQNAYPYGNSYQGQSCNGVDRTGGGTPVPTGSLSSCQGGDTGLFDMSGNVREWTNDPRGPTTYVVRGGAYQTPALGLSCTFDLSQAVQDVQLPATGFRCCSDGP